MSRPRNRTRASTRKWVLKEGPPWFCDHCFRLLVRREDAETDHIVPRSQGGADEPRNAILLCRDCHVAKHREAS